MSKLPHELNNKLRKEDIDIVAYEFLNARNNCLERLDVDNGDTAWSNGVRSREWCREAIRKACNKHNALSILRDIGQSFVFAINGVPVKFFKDNIKNLSSKVYKFQDIEKRQYELFDFSGELTPEDIMWRFVVETSIDLSVSRISLVGIHKKSQKCECCYDVPIDKYVRIISDMTEAPKEAVDIGEAQVSYKKNVQKEGLNGQ